jgi:glycosyltransferase involved in cell wall biosynthesis
MQQSAKFETEVETRSLRTFEFPTPLQTTPAPSSSEYKDRFASLRKAGFNQLSGHLKYSGQVLIENGWADLDILSFMTAIEFDWANAFHSGFKIKDVPFGYVDRFTHSAILRGLNRSGVNVAPADLMEQFGINDTSDSLIRDIIALQQNTDIEFRRGSGKSSEKDGIVIAQFMLLGEIGQAGKGDSGGLGIFLESLGSAMANRPEVTQVYTFVLTQLHDKPVEQFVSAKHSVVFVPMHIGGPITQQEMMKHEAELESALLNALKTCRFEPDIFHIRYADHGSLAVLKTAKRMGKKVAFTLTADPHRTMATQFDLFSLDDANMEKLDFALQRVYVSDRLLEGADGLAVMPNSAGLTSLTDYFPQFELHPEVQSKPLKVLAEGIRLNAPSRSHSKARRIIDQLPAHFLEKPVMLNVGRLHPVKQQHLLVEAWASSGLWSIYNLLLIGGNLDEPNPLESDLLASIQFTLEQYPEAQPYFYLLPAMENQAVRDFESALVQQHLHHLPHIYACSSIKEEFGIAVLEAMDAGLLVIGPQRGGLSSYIDHEDNGFLMDTSSLDGIVNALHAVLISQEYSRHELTVAAAAGQATVRSRFDIQITARQFVDFYCGLLAVEEPQRELEIAYRLY